MTPPRLIGLACRCGADFWVIDHDYRGIGGPMIPYHQRTYQCSECGRDSDGFVVRCKSPPEFLLQPHRLYPMRQYDFDRWAAILTENFPDHPKVRALGRSFVPNTNFDDPEIDEIRRGAAAERERMINQTPWWKFWS